MRRKRSMFADLSLIHFWRQRQNRLSAALSRFPQSNDAWFWAVQRRVTHFLLARYDILPKNEAYDALPQQQLNAETIFQRPPAVSHSNPAANCNSKVPPRDSKHVRPVVLEITTLNLPRYRWLQREYEEIPAIREREAAIARAHALEYEPFRITLTDDQVNTLAALLSESDFAEPKRA